MKGIFVSYRRSDAPDVTGRIYDRLTARYQRNMVFKDVDSIPAGTAFASYIVDTIGQSAAQLVIVGPGWLNATDAAGGRRLDDPKDFVRIEIESALQQGIPVIPVLVSGASLPASADLPPSLQPLIQRNALQVRPDPDFNVDIERLLSALDMWMGRSQPLPQPASAQAPMPSYPGAQGYSSGWQGSPAGYQTPARYSQPAYAAASPMAAAARLPLPKREPQAGSGGARALAGLAYLAMPLAVVAGYIGQNSTAVWVCMLGGFLFQLIAGFLPGDRFRRFSALQAAMINALFLVVAGGLFGALFYMASGLTSGDALTTNPGLAITVLGFTATAGIIQVLVSILMIVFGIAAFRGDPARSPVIGRLALRLAGAPRA